MRKAVKFGGSSLADAVQFQKCAEIIKADPSRLFVVPSAPGKRHAHDTKVTDMLFHCFACKKSILTRHWNILNELKSATTKSFASCTCLIRWKKNIN